MNIYCFNCDAPMDNEKVFNGRDIPAHLLHLLNGEDNEVRFCRSCIRGRWEEKDGLEAGFLIEDGVIILRWAGYDYWLDPASLRNDDDVFTWYRHLEEKSWMDKAKLDYFADHTLKHVKNS